jgi:hypothetical protein
MISESNVQRCLTREKVDQVAISQDGLPAALYRMIYVEKCRSMDALTDVWSPFPNMQGKRPYIFCNGLSANTELYKDIPSEVRHL